MIILLQITLQWDVFMKHAIRVSKNRFVVELGNFFFNGMGFLGEDGVPLLYWDVVPHSAGRVLLEDLDRSLSGSGNLNGMPNHDFQVWRRCMVGRDFTLPTQHVSDASRNRVDHYSEDEAEDSEENNSVVELHVCSFRRWGVFQRGVKADELWKLFLGWWKKLITKLIYSKKKNFLVVVSNVDLADFDFLCHLDYKNLCNFRVEFLWNYKRFFRNCSIQSVFHRIYLQVLQKAELVILLSSCPLLELELLNLVVLFVKYLNLVYVSCKIHMWNKSSLALDILLQPP